MQNIVSRNLKVGDMAETVDAIEEENGVLRHGRKKLMEKTCPNCKRKFQTLVETATYCSVECAKHHIQKEVKEDGKKYTGF